MEDYSKYLTIKSDIRFGKPCIKGTRISVYDILSWLASGMNKDDILNDFPELSLKQIEACLAYAADREHSKRVA